MQKAATWAASLDADKIARECSPVHIASVIKQAQEYIALLTAPVKKASVPRKSKVLPDHRFQAAHYKAAARQGTTPEQLIARQMSSLKRSASSPGPRVYPCGDEHLRSTHAYVHAFYAHNNNLLTSSGREGVDALFQPLNKNPTTWPDNAPVDEQT